MSSLIKIAPSLPGGNSLWNFSTPPTISSSLALTSGPNRSKIVGVTIHLSIKKGGLIKVNNNNNTTMTPASVGFGEVKLEGFITPYFQSAENGGGYNLGSVKLSKKVQGERYLQGISFWTDIFKIGDDLSSHALCIRETVVGPQLIASLMELMNKRFNDIQWDNDFYGEPPQLVHIEVNVTGYQGGSYPQIVINNLKVLN